MAISPGFQRKSQFWRNLFTRNRLRTKQSIHFLPLSLYSYEEPVFWISIVTICSINLSSERWILVYFIGMFFISSYELHSLHAGALIKYHHALSRLTSTLPVVYDIGANVTGCHVTVIRFRSNVPQYSGSQSVMQCGSVICNDCGIKSIHRQPEQCTQFESSLAPHPHPHNEIVGLHFLSIVKIFPVLTLGPFYVSVWDRPLQYHFHLTCLEETWNTYQGFRQSKSRLGEHKGQFILYSYM